MTVETLGPVDERPDDAGPSIPLGEVGPDVVDLVESAQNNLVWALLSMLGFVALLVGGLAVLYVREVAVPDSYSTIIAGVVGAAMTQIGKVIESVAQLLIPRRDKDGA